MQIQVSGKSIKIGDSLKSHVEGRLEQGISKYFDKAIDANVVFSKESHLYRVDVIVNEGTGSGIIIKGNGYDNDIYASFDQAADRIEKQLRRYKRKIKNHHKKKFADLGREEVKLLEAKKYVLAENGSIKEEKEEESPLIIAEKPVKIEKLTVSEAVMKMNLENLPAYMFINKANDSFNVVYHRKDGNISWIDPQRVKSKK